MKAAIIPLLLVIAGINGTGAYLIHQKLSAMQIEMDYSSKSVVNAVDNFRFYLMTERENDKAMEEFKDLLRQEDLWRERLQVALSSNDATLTKKGLFGESCGFFKPVWRRFLTPDALSGPPLRDRENPA